MARKEIKGPINDNTLNNTNHNFKELYDEYMNAGLNAQEARDKANQSLNNSNNALKIARQSNNKSDDTQQQLDNIVLKDGNDIAEVVQARGNEPLLKDRLNKTDQQLAEKAQSQVDMRNVINYELNSKGRKKSGLVVFISDDGHKGDWSELKPLFEAEGVPFCFAVITEWMESTHSHNVTRTTWEQMRYLQNEMRCEALSHSHTHNRPVFMPEMTEFQIREEYEKSIRIMKENGLSVQSFRVPGNQYTTRERNVCREYFRSMVVSDYGYDGLNRVPYETYELKSIWLDNESFGGAKPFSYYKDHIDKAVETDSLLIISTHGYALDGLIPLFKQVVQYAKSASEITTLSDALNRTGNLVEVGDFTKTFNGTERLNRIPFDFQHFAVGSDGIISGSATITDKNRFTSKSNYREFPYGVTITPVYRSHSDGAPGNGSGLLINYRIDDSEPGFNRQEFISYTRPFSTFKRNVMNDWTFDNEWQSKEGINYPHFNEFDHSTPFNKFPIGITFSRVTPNNTNILNAPRQSPGLLVTYKIDESNIYSGYNHQEYVVFKSTETYKRSAISDTEFSDWDIDGGIYLPEANNHGINTPFHKFSLGITYSFVTSQSDENIPDQSPGTLITHRLSNSKKYGMSFQEFHSNYKPGLAIYKRRALGWDEWGEWVKIK